MSEPNNSVVCLVVLVDSSLPVLAEWPEICSNYVRALITRLRESYKPRPVSSYLHARTRSPQLRPGAVPDSLRMLCIRVHYTEPLVIPDILHGRARADDPACKESAEIWSGSDRRGYSRYGGS